MSFSFTKRADVKDQVRRIAIDQVQSAITECRGDGDLDKTVHGLRRRCKKLRGLLRLIEPKCKFFDAENRVVRDAAQGLSGTRDAAVMVETFDALVEFDSRREGSPQLNAALSGSVRRILRGRVIAGPEAIDRQQLLGDLVAALTPLAKRAETWAIEGRGFACLGAGLEQTYRRMRDGMAHARDEGSAEALHDWRKHAKYHWHHVGLLQRAAPELLHGRKNLVDQLAELLGDHHNLHVLHEALTTAPEPVAAEGIETLGDVIAERQAVLVARAFELGRQLAVEKPAALRRRFELYWQLLPDAE
ncbi:CHAD domain-containing protein [Devosia sp.]|uniref:CHAD domain-containing protein n=1 Tax=Devosia sp. TaxID=1871048 RepID=UPI002FCAE12C